MAASPLLAPDVIESLSARLMALMEERGGTYRAGIVTNGYLLTQQVADMLGNARVEFAQITIDVLREAHDASRYLRGGGSTFDRIVSNLRNVKLPFKVHIRHNVHDANREQIEPLKAFVQELAQESGLNTAVPVPDDECQACVWLPMCVGGCPHKRLNEGKQCVPFKNDPERYVLALHARIGEGKRKAKADEAD